MKKQALRERTWDRLEAEGVARFPYPPHGRIPNFAGAEAAADRLAATDEWAAADSLKCNPDAPQLPVRRRALRDGKTLYVAVPRLRDERPFLRLDPGSVDDVDAATTISGIGEWGVPVDPESVAPVDLVVAGSVAVTEAGARVGKGEGYSDLEYGVLREFDRVSGETVVATTVHEQQVVDDDVPVDAHDVPLDLVVTPERVVRTETTFARPAGVAWDEVTPSRREEIPVLDRLAPSERV